jgi:subfamily B ATP-binding cassette protein MsbA
MLSDRFKGIRQTLAAAHESKRSPKEKFRLRDMAYFFQFVRPVWKIGLASFILVIITAGFSALMPLIGKIFIDFVIMNTGYQGVEQALNALGLGGYAPAVIENLSSINFVIVLLLVSGIIYGALNILKSYLSSIYQQELAFNIQTSLYDRVLRFPMLFLKSKQTGYLMSRISGDVGMMQYLFSDALTQIISGAFYVIFGIVILTSINGSFALIIALLLPVYFVVRYLFFNRIRDLSYQEREYSAEVSRDMQEALSGVELVKSFATEQKETAKVSHKLRDAINTRISLTLLISFASSFMPALIFGMLLLFMYVGANNIRNGTMTIGDFVTIITYIMFLSTAMNTLYRTYLSFQPAFASMDRLKEMFFIVPEFEWGDKTRPLKKLDHVRGDISFVNVSFAYNADEPVLKDISFNVKNGESIALVGHSGAGKTTLVSLLLKLYIPQAGQISLDGTDINDLDYAWLRQQISIVSQDIFLFNDTIENNIKYGQLDASREEVIHVAKKAHIHDFIERLPKGYETLIGERGTQLSVGQRQRISIARSLLKNAPIVILDEPTSSIDPETERYLKESLYELMKDRTTIVISHRMSLTEIADRVLVIEDGKIVESGIQKDLDGQDSLYHKMRIQDRVQAG